MVIELDGTASLGVCLKSRFGGKGCYVDDVAEDQRSQSSFVIHVGDLLWSINDESVHDCSIQQVYTKVKSLSFPMILHFRKTSVPRSFLSASDFIGITALRLHPWISHFLVNSSSHPNYDMYQALWSRVFQSAVWLHVLEEMEEEWKEFLTFDHMKRVGNTLMLSFPSHLTNPTEMLNHVRHVLGSYLASNSVQTSLTAMASTFSASLDYARMVAFYPHRNGWQYVPLGAMITSGEGMLCLAAILAGSSSLWRMIVIAHGYATADVPFSTDDEHHPLLRIVWEVTTRMLPLAAIVFVLTVVWCCHRLRCNSWSKAYFMGYTRMKHTISTCNWRRRRRVQASDRVYCDRCS